MLARQREFRVAADAVTDAWIAFPEVRAVAVIGSVGQPRDGNPAAAYALLDRHPEETLQLLFTYA